MVGAPQFEGDLQPAHAPAQRVGPRRATPLTGAVDTKALPAVDDTPVSTVMTRDVATMPLDMDVVAAAQLLLDRGISGAPVVDEEGRPIGMVSKTDLLEALRHDDTVDDPLAVPVTASAPKESQRIVVGDLMVPYLLAISARSPISLAAALMAYEGVHRLLVLDEANNLVGIVSALDVLRWVAQLSGFCLPHHTQQQRT